MAPLELTFDEKRIWESPAVKFDPTIDCVRHGAEQAAFRCATSSPAPATIPAIRPRGADDDDLRPLQGRHQPQRGGEYDPEECAAGAQVLLNAVLEYDRRFAG